MERDVMKVDEKPADRASSAQSPPEERRGARVVLHHATVVGEHLAAEHHVRLDACFTSLGMAVEVMEGIAKTLDPGLDAVAKAKAVIFRDAVEKAAGRAAARLGFGGSGAGEEAAGKE